MSVPHSPLKDLVRALTLEARGKNSSGEDLFQGPSQWMPHGRVFGGQVLAQCLMAAQHTIEGHERAVHSMHGYFLRPGDIELPISFTVDRLRDGRSFSTRRLLLSWFGGFTKFTTNPFHIEHSSWRLGTFSSA